MTDIVTNITAHPLAQGDTRLQVTGRTDFGDGGHDEVSVLMTNEEYEAMRRISRQLADDVPKRPGNPNPDGSNVMTALQLALIKRHRRRGGLEPVEIGTPLYETAKLVASENQLRPHYELVDSFLSAMIAADKSPPSTWVDRTTQGNEAATQQLAPSI